MRLNSKWPVLAAFANGGKVFWWNLGGGLALLCLLTVCFRWGAAWKAAQTPENGSIPVSDLQWVSIGGYEVSSNDPITVDPTSFPVRVRIEWATDEKRQGNSVSRQVVDNRFQVGFLVARKDHGVTPLSRQLIPAKLGRLTEATLHLDQVFDDRDLQAYQEFELFAVVFKTGQNLEDLWASGANLRTSKPALVLVRRPLLHEGTAITNDSSANESADLGEGIMSTISHNMVPICFALLAVVAVVMIWRARSGDEAVDQTIGVGLLLATAVTMWTYFPFLASVVLSAIHPRASVLLGGGTSTNSIWNAAESSRLAAMLLVYTVLLPVCAHLSLVKRVFWNREFFKSLHWFVIGCIGTFATVLLIATEVSLYTGVVFKGYIGALAVISELCIFFVGFGLLLEVRSDSTTEGRHPVVHSEAEAAHES